MPDSKVLAVWEDFSGGHYDPATEHFDTTTKCLPMPPNTFIGTNVIPSTSGVLMMRKGITTLTSTNTNGSTPNAAGRGGNNDLYFTTTTRSIIRWTTGITATAGTLWGASDQLGLLFADNKMYVGTSGTTGFHTYDGSTYANPSTTVRGTCLAVFKDRLYIGGDLTGTGYRLWYSEPADYDNFGASNFLDIPPAFGRIQCLEVFDDQLVIGMQNSISEVPRWWVLTDNPKTGGSLQEIGNGPYVYDFRSVAKIQDGIVVAAANGIYLYTGGRQFNRIDNVFYLRNAASQSTGGGQIAVSEDGYSCVVCDPFIPYIFHYNGHRKIWTRHTNTSNQFNTASGDGKLVVPNGPSTWAFFRDNAITGSGPYNIAHQMDFSDNFLPTAIDSYTEAVDTDSGSSFNVDVYLSTVVVPDGRTVNIRELEVEYYQHGSSPILTPTVHFSDTNLVTGSDGSFTCSATPSLAFGNGVAKFTVNEAGTKVRKFQPRLQFSQLGIRRVIAWGTINEDREAR